MFSRKKDEGDAELRQDESRADSIASSQTRSREPQSGAILTPPSLTPMRRPEAPRRPPELPGEFALRPDQPDGDEARKLIVGREIILNGEINSCDRLIVEGRVEANMKDCSEIEIAETGTFKGLAEIERADISGKFEGDLTAREHLVVRATGRITGNVKFGELEIERGGQIVGDVQVFSERAESDQDSQDTVNTPIE